MNQDIHHVPGRLRVRCVRVKRNAAAAAAAQHRIREIDGVVHVDVSQVTGSIVITYDRSRTCPHALLEELKRSGCCDRASVLPAHEAPQQAVGRALSGAGSAVGKAVFGVVMEKLVERSAVALIGALL